MMRRGGAWERIVAGMLMATVAAYFVPASAGVSAAASNPASGVTRSEIRGNVFGADGLTTMAGVSVKAANMETHTIYTSNPTGADGVYNLRDLPPGSYDLAVLTPQGLYAADALVEARAGRRTTVSLAIRSAAQGREEDPNQPGGEKPPEEKPEEPKPEGAKEGEKPPEPQAQKPSKKGGGFWRSPAGAAIAIVAGAVVVGIAANSAVGDDEEDDEPLTQNAP